MWDVLEEVGGAAGLLDALLLGLGQLADVAIHGVLEDRGVSRTVIMAGGYSSGFWGCGSDVRCKVGLVQGALVRANRPYNGVINGVGRRSRATECSGNVCIIIFIVSPR